MSEYLNFEEDDDYPYKTKLIVVISKRTCETLGQIKWDSHWRQYTFWPMGDTIWNKQCMLDIINYINKLMDERK